MGSCVCTRGILIMPLVTRPVCIQTLGRFAAAILRVLHHLNVMSLHVFGVSGCPVSRDSLWNPIDKKHGYNFEQNNTWALIVRKTYLSIGSVTYCLRSTFIIGFQTFSRVETLEQWFSKRSWLNWQSRSPYFYHLWIRLVAKLPLMLSLTLCLEKLKPGASRTLMKPRRICMINGLI